MALATQRNQVRYCVRFCLVFEITNPLNMMHIQFLSILFFCYLASLAGIVISLPGEFPLSIPVSPIIRFITSLPSWAFLSLSTNRCVFRTTLPTACFLLTAFGYLINRSANNTVSFFGIVWPSAFEVTFCRTVFRSFRPACVFVVFFPADSTGKVLTVFSTWIRCTLTAFVPRVTRLSRTGIRAILPILPAVKFFMANWAFVFIGCVFHKLILPYSDEYCKLAEKRVRGANVPLFT